MWICIRPKRDEEGRQISIDPKFMELRVKKANYELGQKGLVFRQMIKQVSGVQELRVMVRDASSGLLGCHANHTLLLKST